MNNRNLEKQKNRWNKIVYFFKSHWTTPFKLMICYILFIIIGSCLLYIPGSLEHGYNRWMPVEDKPLVFDGSEYKLEYKTNDVYPKLTFWDSMFIITSAFTNTGLSVTDIDYTYTFFGEFVIYVWIQLGGFGLLAFCYLVGKAINRISEKIKPGSRLVNPSFVGLVERSGTKISKSGKILFSIFIINLTIQLFFSFIISFIIYSHPFNEVAIEGASQGMAAEIPGMTIDSYHNYGKALWKSIFLVGSTINNAGLDLFGSYSLSIFRNDLGILIQIFLILIFVFGGIGYTCVYDVYYKGKEIFWKTISKINNKFGWKDVSYKIEQYSCSILTKLCLWMTLIMAVSSIVLTFATEYLSWAIKISEYSEVESLLSSSSRKLYFNDNYFNQNFYLIFMSMTTRSAGFATVDVNNVQDATKWLFIILMFIGTSPASTGGGIRTTTVAVIVMSVFQKETTYSDPKLFKRRVTKRTSIEAFQVFVIAILLIILATVLILTFENQALNDANYSRVSTTNIILEISSAFGTTGLSCGVTNNLNPFSMLLLMIIMFIGQLGIANTLTTFKSKYRAVAANTYPELELVVG